MAVPNPEVEWTRVDQLAGRGLPPVVIVTGASDWFRNSAMDRLLAAVPAAAELRIVDAQDEAATGGDDDDDGTGGAVCPELQELVGGGLFARQAFLAVRRGSHWWRRYAAVVAAMVARFAPGCGLLLEAAKLDKRKKAAAALAKDVAAAGHLFEFRELYELPYDRSQGAEHGELCRWVVRRSQGLGVPLSADSALLLIAEVGREPGELLAELERLRHGLGADRQRRPLSPAELRGRITTSFASNPFEFAEALLANDRARASRSLAAMFQRGVKSRDGKPMDVGGLLPFTTSWLFGQLARTYEARRLLDAGTAARDLPAQFGVRQFADRFVEQVRANDRQRLVKGLRALHAVQRASRSTGEEPQVLLERLLASWFGAPTVPIAEDDAL